MCCRYVSRFQGSGTRSHKRERNSGTTWSLLLSHCQVLKQQASPVVCQSTGGKGNSSPSWTIPILRRGKCQRRIILLSAHIIFAPWKFPCVEAAVSTITIRRVAKES